MRSLPIALAAAAVAATVSLACGQDEEAVPPEATAAPTLTPVPASPTPAVKGQLWRWVNVTVVIPEGSDVQGAPQDASADLKPPSGGPALQLIREGTGAGRISSVLIDAETGTILVKEILEEDRAAIEQVLETVVVAPVDPATAPWPYTGRAPEVTSERIGNVRFIRPDPASGIQMWYGISDSFGSSPASLEYLRITNGRSTVVVDAKTGQRLERNETVVPRDVQPFERLISSIQLCGRDVDC